MAGFPLKLPGAVQFEMSTERIPPDASVAVLRQVVAAPELSLRDGRERPVRVEVDRVAVGERLVGLEIELDAVHPLRPKLAEPRQRRCSTHQLRREKSLHDLHRHRRDMVSRRSPLRVARCARPRRCESGSPSRLNARTVAFGTNVTPSRSVRCASPRIDPHVVRRSVQQAIEHASRNEDAVEKLQQDAPDGARAALLGAHGDERTGHPLPEISAIVLGPCAPRR